MTTISKNVNRKTPFRLFRKPGMVDSVLQSLEVVNNLETELVSALKKANTAESTSTSLSSEWDKRSEKAKSMLKLAETPEALQAMEVLAIKATRFSDFYRQVSEKDKSQSKEINESLAKIRMAQKQLTAVEKTQALDATLQKMAEEANITLEDSPSLDHREISRVIHSAQALVELKTGRL
jgi:hypothetical protein